MESRPDRPARPTDPGPAPATTLPAPIARRLQHLGLPARSFRDVTARPGRRPTRLTLRIELTDGRLLKARLLHRDGVAERMRTWLPRLDARHFPRLVDAADRVSLEEWREGFLAPHDLRAGGTGYAEHADHWQLAAALRSADWRLREGCDGLEFPLAEVHRQVG